MTWVPAFSCKLQHFAFWLTDLRAPQSFVDIVVGPDSNPVKFTVNRDILYHHSPTFKAYFQSRWEEGQTNIVRLDEVDEETFGMVQHWLYRGELIFGDDDEPHHRYLVLLSKVWNFGDKYLIPPLQNKAIDSMHYILGDDSLASPKELKAFVNHAFPVFENNNDQNGNKITPSAPEKWALKMVSRMTLRLISRI